MSSAVRGRVSCVFAVVVCLFVPQKPEAPSYLDPAVSLERRVDDLVGRMTLDEKITQMMDRAAAIPRLQVPEYNWWNEALHGVARAGLATGFPQAIGFAATWDNTLVRRMATVISDEARAKHHDALRRGNHDRYFGLTIWSPNINLFRDPRWGRGQETYGEDPLLASHLAIEFVRGLQGDDPRYLKTVSTVEHFAVHSGPEPERHTFDAVVDERALHEDYLRHFETAIPPFEDCRMTGRTYRYFQSKPLYSFGHGLSYTSFRYDRLRTSAPELRAGGAIAVRVDVTNTGKRAGDEVVQLYVQHAGSKVPRPLIELRGYSRVALQPGETRTVELPLRADDLAYWDTSAHGWVTEADRVRLRLGASSTDLRVDTTVAVRAR